MKKSGRNTLILHNGGLGDLLLSLPAIRCIREGSGLLHLAGKCEAVEFLREVNVAHTVSSSGGAVLLSLYNGNADQEVIKFLEPFRRAYLFSEKGNSTVAMALNKVIPEVNSILTRSPGTTLHVADHQLQQLKDCIMEKGAPLFMDLPPSLSQRARSVLFHRGITVGQRPLIVIHPGSGGKQKNWPPDRFAELAGLLSARHNGTVIFLLGPAEEAWHNNSLLHYCEREKDGIFAFVNPDLWLAAGILFLADAYVGNDSGITHLASAVNTKTIAIFGPTDPSIWGPVGRKTKIIVSGRDCVPCGDVRSRCIARHCLDDIKPDFVYREVLNLLERDGLSGDQGIRTIFP